MAGGVLAPGSLDSATRRAIENLWDLLPRGTVGYAQIVANQGGIVGPTDITGLVVAFTADPRRRYRVSIQSFMLSSAVSDVCLPSICNASNVVQQYGGIVVASTTYAQTVAFSVVLSGLAGAQTMKMRAERQFGTGSISVVAGATYPAYILVEDIGPA